MQSDQQTKRNIAANLRRMLGARKVSQNGLARLTEESPPRINAYCNARMMPGVGVLARIAEVLETTIDDLVAPPKRGTKKSA